MSEGLQLDYLLKPRVFGTQLQNLFTIPQQKPKKIPAFQEKYNQNPQDVSIYQEQIYKYLQQQEVSIKVNYMDHQHEINQQMRQILLYWLVDVHGKFKLQNETLFLTQYIIDAYLSKNKIQRNNLQLLGVTAIFIASKYQEIYPPNLSDFVQVTDNAYSNEDCLDMEGKILISLNFKLQYTSPLFYLQKYCKLLNIDDKNFHLAWQTKNYYLLMKRYLVELSMINYEMLKYSQKFVAIGTIYLVNKVRLKQKWDQQHVKITDEDDNSVSPCAKQICILLQQSDKSELNAIKRKFSTVDHYQVAKLKLEKTQ